MADGSSVEVSEDQQWALSIAGKRKRRKKNVLIPVVPVGLRPEDEWNLHMFQRCRIANTIQLNNYIMKENKKEKSRTYYPQLPMTAPVCFTGPPGKWPTLPPYTLGALIGDGYLNERNVKFVSADLEIVEQIKKELDGKFQVNEISKKGKAREYRISGKVGQKTNSPQALLKREGLLGAHSNDKFIPKRIKLASTEIRFSFVQGLFDTDGYIDNRGHIEYVTVSEQLAMDVQWLVRSLGYKATLSTKLTSYTKNGKRIPGQLAYRMYIRGPFQENLFSLMRKRGNAKKYNGGDVWPSNKILSIEPTKVYKVLKFTIDHPNNLYIANDFIVTHI